MKIYINAFNSITKLNLNWFQPLSLRFEMRANLLAVIASPAVRTVKGPGVQTVERHGLFLQMKPYVLPN